MKRIAFFSTPSYGHLTAVHPVVARLVHEGNEVTWYCSARYREFVELSGARFEEYTYDFEQLCNLSEATGNLYHLFEHLLRLNRQFYIHYNRQFASADLILYDSMCSFAKNLARRRGIPHICLCTTLAYNAFTFLGSNLFLSTLRLIIRHRREGMQLIREENRFRKAEQLPRLNLMDIFVNKGDRTLVFSPRQFQPWAWTFGRDFDFVGNTVAGRTNTDTTQYPNDYDIYISLGSIFTERRELLERFLASPFLRSHRVIINIGNAAIQTDCPNVTLVHHTNQQALLQHCRLFVNHGGLNSVFESIHARVPQVCIPQQEEQRMNAKIVARKGLGLYMHQFDEQRLATIWQQLDAYRQRIDAFARDIERQDGTTASVRIIKTKTL